MKANGLNDGDEFRNLVMILDDVAFNLMANIITSAIKTGFKYIKKGKTVSV